MNVIIDYTWLGKIEKDIRASDYIIKEIHYLDTVTIDVYVHVDQVTSFMEWVVELTNGQCRLEKGEIIYLEK